MTGKTIGYIRVSSELQNTERQLDGVEVDKLFTDKLSGKNGDTLVVHSMDRLARNLDDLRKLVKELTEKKVKVKFIKEGLEFTGDDSPMSTLLLSVMGAFAEFERSLIKERQMEGIALAKKRGAYKGRKRTLNDEQLNLLKSRVLLGENKTLLAKEFGVSRETLYQYLRG